MKDFPAGRLTAVEFFCILDRSSYEKRDEEKAMNQLSKVVCTAAACLVAAVTVNRAENSQRSARDFAWVQERAQKLEPPAIVVIGEIVKLRDELAVAAAIPAKELKSE